jgi:predicted permease
VLSRLRSTVAALFRRRRFEATMDDELHFHLEAYTNDLVHSGVPRAEAERRARLEFGAVQAVKEECRQSRGLQAADELRQDLHYAGRQLKKSPGFAAAAVLSLALGIGANTAVFSLMDAVLFRTLPIAHPEQLYYLGHGVRPNRSTSANYPLFERYQKANVLAGVTAYNYMTFTVRSDQGVERVVGQYVTGNYHAVLGVPMVAGRGFSSEPDRGPAGLPIAVISHAYWTRQFGQSPDVIGKTLNIQGRAVTIVGVTAPSFHGLESGIHFDLTLPLSFRAIDEPQFLDARDGWTSFPIVGRLKHGMSEAQALAAVDRVFQPFWQEPENGWAREDPANKTRPAVILPAARGSSDLRRKYSEPLRVMMGMVALVLLIACANVANLLLARAAARTKEVAVRLGLGAGRRRLVRQFLTESALLAVAGGAVGLLVAFGATRAILSVFPAGPSAVIFDVTLNTRVLLFTLGASLLTGIGFGLVPAFKATRLDLTPSLKASGNLGPGRLHSPVGRTLLVAQLALCVLVVSAAGLLVRSLRNLRTLDAGFTRSNVLLFDVNTATGGFTSQRRAAFYPELARRLSALPGVESAALADRSPLDFSMQVRRLEVLGRAPTPSPEGVSAVAVTPQYFQAFGVTLLRGRLLTEQDREGVPRVALVNQSMARGYFGNASPLGRFIIVGGRRDTVAIVGVVSDVRHEQLREAAPPSVYTPLAQLGEAFDGGDPVPMQLTAVLRTAGDPRSLARLVPGLVRQVNRDAVVEYVRTMDQQLDAALVSERLLASLSSGFGLLALLLAAVGLYGVMSYGVARRAREIGIRMALGATRGIVLRRVLRESMLLAAAGVGIGLGAALLTTRVVAAFLFGLSPGDPATLATVAALLIATTLLAGLLPARRAARVDPMRVLHAE